MPNRNNKKKLLRLLDKYVKGTATVGETAFLESYYDHFDELAKETQKDKEVLPDERHRLEAALLKRIDARIAEMEGFHGGQEKLHRRPWFRIAAAAAVVLCCIGTGYLYIGRPSTRSAVTIGHDLQPGKMGALLTFENKRPPILLDTARNGLIASGVTKSAAKVRVGPDAAASGDETEIMYATLSTPNARTQALELPDGSMVWLNASSSIRFPTRFTRKERVVEVTGEVDLKVTHNERQPFKVVTGGQEWEVLGTEFDINAYGDEPVIRTTLLEGALRTRGVVLKPGQQSIVKRAGDEMRILKDVNTAEAVAWKDGIFVFSDHTDLATVMREIARWYDVSIEYQGPVPELELGGKIPRNSNASEVLKILSYSTNVRFGIEQKKIIVINH
jgi:transmembrane sensor